MSEQLTLLDWEPRKRPPRDPDPDFAVPQDVLELFEHIALTIWERGYRHFSSDAILHRIRYHYLIDKGDREFKCNNNWTSSLARWLLAKHPEMEGFFELRRSPQRGDG
jgi:hypothetical protein